jgi:hypothetical protein
VTVSLITTSIVTVAPAAYRPSALVERTELTVGAAVSITIDFAPPKESALAVAGKVITAELPERSAIVPEFRLSADVLM